MALYNNGRGRYRVGLSMDGDVYKARRNSRVSDGIMRVFRSSREVVERELASLERGKQLVF